MLSVNNVSIRFGTRMLFENANIKFLDGNCYGIIGANGSGKTTFLRLLSGEIDTTSGDITYDHGQRISTLKQNHYEYDDVLVIDTVCRGNKRLYEIECLKDELYSHTQFSDEDGMKLAELENEYVELNGWDKESDASILLNNLGVDSKYYNMLMRDVPNNIKVKVLLAQCLFGDPDILLLDEPTNNLDTDAISWLEEFLINYKGIVIVVSHDRYFLNKVCTHIVDIDFGKMKLYIGNYDFWYLSSQLALKQMKESNKKKEDKILELQDFIARFSANASKSKQATSRKKMLEKIVLDEIVPSSRKYPFIDFKFEKPSGKEILEVRGLCKTIDDKKIINNISFTVLKGDKIAIVGKDSVRKSALFKILMREMKYDKGEISFGKTVKCSYFPQDNTSYFLDDVNILEWIAKFYDVKDETFLRSFLGRMLFSNDDVYKNVKSLSGGEKARCLLAKMMLEKPNFLILDEPTNHLDLESITALNNGLSNFEGEILLATHDHQLIDTVCNRIIEITDNGIIDKRISYDEYLALKDRFVL